MPDTLRKGGRFRPPRTVPGVLIALAIAAAAAGCGISVGSGEEGTELFKELTVTGDFVPGGRLFLDLAYEQPYPVDVQVECVLIATSVEGLPTAVPPPTVEPEDEPSDEPTEVPIPLPLPTPKNKVLDVLTSVVPRNEEGGGPVEEATPTMGTIEGGFDAPPYPGRYLLQCQTPSDADNRIGEEFEIEEA